MSVDRILGTIDQAKFADIAARHASDEAAKYLDLPKWIEINLRRVQKLCLDASPRRRVLDIGCGAGYFLYICKLLGHEVVGVDLPGQAMFSELTELLGVPVVPHRVEPMQPLPDLGGPFDVATAFMITFNGHCTDRVWGPKEWRFLLDGLRADRVYLELNREHDGTLWQPGLYELFDGMGARVQAHRVLIDRR